MPDKNVTGGWRKKIHTRSSALKLNQEENTTTDEGHRRHPEKIGWRKSSQSRPETPISATGLGSFPVDDEDVRQDSTADVSTPRRATKPKLSRYLSGYRSLKDAAKEAEFTEPWSEDAPPSYPAPVDPLTSLQAVYSHMTCVPNRAIPPEYNAGLFRVFEDYRKIREEKERLECLLKETLEGYQTAEQHWSQAELQYQEEIRRLELLIARGTSGMAGLVKARQESVVKRGRAHRKSISASTALHQNVSWDQLDEQIRMRSRQVLLQRSTSPSGKMTALSRRLDATTMPAECPIGTPPSQETRLTLSRKVKSELNLTCMRTETADTCAHSVESGFSRHGDPLPDEIEHHLTMADPFIDCDAFVALQELGALVARKKGIDVSKFMTGLLQLFSVAEDDATQKCDTELQWKETAIPRSGSDAEAARDQTPPIPNPRLRSFRSQPQLGSLQRRRRHFSFEPGDDQIPAFEDDVMMSKSPRTHSLMCLVPSGPGPDSQMPSSSVKDQNLNPDFQKPSKIPFPIQHPGVDILRQGSSVASLPTTSGRQYNGERRDSRSSVLTAFRHNSNSSLRSTSQSRSNSVHAARRETHASDPASSLGLRSNMAALAAARAADHADNSSLSRTNVARTTPMAAECEPSSRAYHVSKRDKTEKASQRQHV